MSIQCSNCGEAFHGLTPCTPKGKAPTEIAITMTGIYPLPMPDDLMTALSAEIQAHMSAYGLKDIRVFGTQGDTA